MSDAERRPGPKTIAQIIRTNLWSPTRPDSTDTLRKLAARPVSVILRHLDCGSCNGCEQQLIALGNPWYDSERYGIGFEASPRHAVYLAMTGVFTRGLAQAAELTLNAMPEPAIIMVGACAIDGGPFAGSYALAPRPPAFTRKGERGSLVRLEIPGCPPEPLDILNALAGLVSPAPEANTTQPEPTASAPAA